MGMNLLALVIGLYGVKEHLGENEVQPLSEAFESDNYRPISRLKQ
jgi:hypothetical protein